MARPYLTAPDNPAAVDDYRRQAHDSLAQSRKCLAANDLHGASESGWIAAAWMAKAVATAQGWSYKEHDEFSVVLRDACRLTGDNRLPMLDSTAHDLHGNFFIRKRFLNAEEIGMELDDMAELLDILEPLTADAGQQEQAGAPSFTADS